jgi:hypothetical protein
MITDDNGSRRIDTAVVPFKCKPGSSRPTTMCSARARRRCGVSAVLHSRLKVSESPGRERELRAAFAFDGDDVPPTIRLGERHAHSPDGSHRLEPEPALIDAGKWYGWNTRWIHVPGHVDGRWINVVVPANWQPWAYSSDWEGITAMASIDTSNPCGSLMFAGAERAGGGSGMCCS